MPCFTVLLFSKTPGWRRGLSRDPGEPRPRRPHRCARLAHRGPGRSRRARPFREPSEQHERAYDLQEGLKHWTRTEDLRAALDWLAAQSDLAAHADFSRIYAVGFSAGGWTALSLGGLRADLEGYGVHCETAPPSPWHCADLARRGADLNAYSATVWNASRKDDRIRAVAAIDPALTYGLGKIHARDLVDKVLLIGFGDTETRLLATDFSETGSGFAAHLPDAEIETMAPATHFSALPPCKPQGPSILSEEGDDPLCNDPQGTERAALHKRVVARIAAFLDL